MQTESLLRRRLAVQRLTSAGLATAAEAVSLLTCVQSQERDHAFFSLGVRTKGGTYGSVRAELDTGRFLRTHILRPTWHFVAPEDLQWILALTSPRVIRGMAARHRQLGLDDARFVNRSLDALAEFLRGRNHLTREELGREAGRSRRRLPAPGAQLGHLLLLAELRGLICSGPTKGVHHSYALVDEVVPPATALDPAEAHARLARRFFAGHGPASVADFTRWSSLPAAGTRAALDAIGPELERVEIDGEPHWFDPALPRRRASAPAAFLVPVYDEAVLTYPRHRFPAVPDHPRGGRPDPFWAPVVAGLRDVGVWKRTVARDRVVVQVELAPSLGPDDRAAVREAAGRLASFLARELEYVESPS
jgi:hypothetical protein